VPNGSDTSKKQKLQIKTGPVVVVIVEFSPYLWRDELFVVVSL
jgi:hypothetical protein